MHTPRAPQNRATQQKLTNSSVSDFVGKYSSLFPSLADKLASEAPNIQENKVHFSNHLPLTELSKGLKARTLFRGVIRSSREPNESYVVIRSANDTRKYITIRGEDHTQRHCP